MGKNVSIYLTDEEVEKLEEYKRKGIKKSAALRQVFFDKDKYLIERLDEITRLLKEMRAAPIMRMGEPAPLITVQPERKVGLLKRLKKKLFGG
ncbi:MAG: hypothetical protein AB1485_00195 [Candidatus Thermoplasmatota archaeon]